MSLMILPTMEGRLASASLSGALVRDEMSDFVGEEESLVWEADDLLIISTGGDDSFATLNIGNNDRPIAGDGCLDVDASGGVGRGGGGETPAAL